MKLLIRDPLGPPSSCRPFTNYAKGTAKASASQLPPKFSTIALHDAGRTFLIGAMTGLMSTLDVDGERLVEARIRLRLACTFAGETAKRVAEILAAEAGTASILESFTFERSTRDLDAAIKHIAMSANVYVTGGRHALGLDPGSRF